MIVTFMGNTEKLPDNPCHEPRDLKNIDLSVLQGRIVWDNSLHKFIVKIGNASLKAVLPHIISNTKERCRVLAKYYLYKYYIKKKKARYCACGELIIDKPWVDVCNKCIKENK